MSTATPKDSKDSKESGRASPKCAARIARELFKALPEDEAQDSEALELVKAQTDRMNDKIRRMYALMKEAKECGGQKPRATDTDRERLRGARILFQKVDAEVKCSEALRAEQLAELAELTEVTHLFGFWQLADERVHALAPLEAGACEALADRVNEALSLPRTLPCFAELRAACEREEHKRAPTEPSEALGALLKNTSAEFQERFHEREHATGLALKLSEMVERLMCCEAGDVSFQEADEWLYTELIEALQILQEAVDVAQIESDARAVWTEGFQRVKALIPFQNGVSTLVGYHLTDYLAFEEAALSARQKIGRAAHLKLIQLSKAMKVRKDLSAAFSEWPAAVPVPATGPEQQHDDEEHEEEE